MKSNFSWPIIVMVLCFLGGLFFGQYIEWRHTEGNGPATYNNPSLRIKDSRYKLISPLLDGGALGQEQFQEFKPLEEKIQKIIDTNLSAKNASTISVYFRDLNLGRRFSINDTNRYFPASLSKVPLMIAYLKLAESKPNLLSEQIVYEGTFNANDKQNVKPKNPLKPHMSYTIDELISAMILYSDNNATRLLFNHMDSALLSEVFSDFNAPFPRQDKLDVITIKAYSYFFRVLYNATYLSRPMSEKALALLTQSDFKDGIRAAAPKEVTIAEKYGESTIVLGESEIQSRELHDCGIVYYPASPYLLCIMTKGDDFGTLTRIIQDISKTIYEAVNSPSYQTDNP